MIDFETLRIANKTRCAELWEREGATPWTGADWGNEMGGECGEAQNVIKKLRRRSDGRVAPQVQQDERQMGRKDGASRMTLLDACREVMNDPDTKRYYPDGVAPLDIL